MPMSLNLDMRKGVSLLQKHYVVVAAAIIFVLGLVFYARNQKGAVVEALSIGGSQFKCPNILVQEGSAIFLKNTNLAEIPGVNPIRFDNLEEYAEFYRWQKSQGIECPILYLQKTYGSQGDAMYKLRPDIFDTRGGLNSITPNTPSQQGIGTKLAGLSGLKYETSLLLDSSRNDPPYNKNSYPGFDPQNQYIGLETPIDPLFKGDPSTVSANPMDTNWGGAKYSREQVKEGKYVQDYVYNEDPST
jgi:hypothetical protein